MKRRSFLGFGALLATVGAALRVATPGRAAVQTMDGSAFEVGKRYYMTGGIYQVIDRAGAEANGATVIDLSASARKAILMPQEPLADVSALPTDTRQAAWFSEGQGLLTRDGFAYRVASEDSEDYHLVTDGGVKLYAAGRRLSVDAFGADPTGERDNTEAFTRALRFCAAMKVPGYSSGRYRISGTLAPGRKYGWDWGETILDFSGTYLSNLIEIYENPQ